MQSFLARLSQTIIKDHPKDMGDVVIILPSRRAAVFLNNEFQQQLKQSSWLPKIYSLEDFIISLAKYSIIDSIDLIFELYKVHQQIEKEKAEPLEEFMSWGGILLQDFNEIDRYLIDSKSLYNYLAEVREIENWNVQSPDLSDFQKNYLRFWQKLSSYYQLFTEGLLQKNVAYQGLAFRKIAEKLQSKEIAIDIDSSYYFAGFNALTKSEEQIIESFVTQAGAQLLWDADEYYMQDTRQEAGKFLREYQKGNKGFQWTTNYLMKGEKEINIYGISGNIGQAKLIGEILSQKTTDIPLHKTAVVLSDENLLMPVLESIPSEIDQLNVTMGNGLNNSIFYHFFETLISLHYKNSKGDSIQNGFYFKDVLALLKQVVFQFFTPSVKEEIKKIIEKIKDERLIYISAKEFDELEQLIGFKIINLQEPNANGLNSVLLQISKQIKSNAYQKLNDLEKEFLFGFYKAFNRIEEISKKENTFKSYETLLQLYRQILSTESVAFVGEPLNGLQLMGVLESRTLDFEHLIISSLNEGVLPAGKSQNSFIPYDIKRQFQLPSYREKDAIFAYHFYRLLQRARKVDLIYNCRIDPLNGGEMSRFVKQLIQEMPIKNPLIKINHRILSPSLKNEDLTPLRIPKTSKHLELIKAHLSRSLSPSAINCFLQCSLDYYYRYILSMREEEVIQEQIENHSFGEIVHNTLEELYHSSVGQILDLKSMAEMKKKVEITLQKHYKNILKILPNQGNHRLAFEVAKKMVHDFIRNEEKSIKAGVEIHLIGLEEWIEADITVKHAIDDEIKVRIKGKIDRIDRMNGQLRIIDYKSGKVVQKDINYKLEQLTEPKHGYSRQLLLYQMAYEKKVNESVQSGIISFRNIKSGFLTLTTEDAKSDAEKLLQFTIAEMLDLQKPFEHNEEALYCNFCSA